MMELDTQIYEELDHCIQKALHYLLSTICGTAFKGKISQKLYQLSMYCGYRVQSFQEAEQLLQNKQSALQFTYFAQSINGYIVKPGMSKVKNSGLIGIGAGGSFRWDALQAVQSQSLSILNVTFCAKAAHVGLEGEAYASLFNAEGKLDPQAAAYASASACLAQASLSLQTNVPYIGATAKVSGSLGAVYAEAQAVLSKEEQTLKLKAGAAAVTGEAQCAFDVFGIKVTLSGSASLGCAEAELTYTHKNREWEFGSKLGFIAGLGFRVKVEY